MNSLDTIFANECHIRMKWKLKEDVVRNAQGSLYSAEFSSNIPGVKYYLEFCPNENNENKAKAYLHLKFNMTKKICVTSTISVKSASSKVKIINQIFENSIGWGSMICKYDELFNPERKFFVDGIIEIELEGILKAQGIKRKAPESFSLANYLWESNDKDLTVTVADQQIMVHKWILCANSTVFENELKTVGRRAAKKNITIPDFTYDVVKIAVEFCYERNIKEFINEENAAELLSFAKKYSIKHFHTFIQNELAEKISKENVCKFANISVEFEADELREFCVCFLMKFIGQSALIDDFKNLNDEITSEIGQRAIFSTCE